MHVKYLQCIKCRKKYSRDEIRFRCDCGESLQVIYDYREIKGNVSWRKLRRRPFRHWRYREFFPVMKKKNIVSLEEGGTPLLKSKNIGKGLGFKNLYLKCENENPTGSFKDRGTTVELSKAIEFGAKEVVCASTGNMGASVAAYCSAANIKANIIIPKDTPRVKKTQIMSYGAKVEVIDGDYSRAAEIAYRKYMENGYYLTGDYPYRGEGEKSTGHEIADEFEKKRADYVFSPIGNGTLIQGIWKGFKEMKKVGLINWLPKMAGIQAEGCSTVVSSFRKNLEKIKPVSPKTLAGAIACGSPLDGLEALASLRESRGLGETVTDREIISARKLLAKKEGIYAEPSGAVSLAGLIRLKDKIDKEKSIICIISGHGLKVPKIF